MNATLKSSVEPSHVTQERGRGQSAKGGANYTCPISRLSPWNPWLCALLAMAQATVVVVRGQPTDCLPPPPGLLGWWPGDGDANDIVGGDNGVLTNGAVAAAQGLVGQAFAFDGVDSYVLLPNLVAGLNEGTVEFWFNLNSWNWTSGLSGLFLWSSTQYLPDSGSTFDGINLGCHRDFTATGELMFGIFDNGGWHWALSGVTPQTGLWYHVAGTWGPNGLLIYINGALSGSNVYPLPAPSYVQYHLLGRSSFTNSVIDGLIDEFSLYNRALSPAEIAAIYASGSAGKCKGPSLNIAPTANNVLVWWPATASGFVLESSTRLGTNQTWNPCSGAIVIVDQNVFVANAGTGSRFFRLHRP